MMAFMAVVTVTGPPGCRVDELAREAARRLGYELVGEHHVRKLVSEAYGSEVAVPDPLFGAVLAEITAQLAARHHLVVVWPGAELALAGFPALLRVGTSAPKRFRAGSLMADHALDRRSAASLLASLDQQHAALRKRQCSRAVPRPEDFDLIVNTATAGTGEAAALIELSATSRGIDTFGLLRPDQQATIEFKTRMALSGHGITPAGPPSIERRPFANRSEQIFANLLDFYRIAWEYEPRAFPLRWESDGRIAESFTPDFYLPEFDTYIELTTMKQSLVTRKNRKVRQLRSLYPGVNIQVLYQRDFQDLVFRFGLSPATP